MCIRDSIRTVKYALVDFSQMIEMKITSEIVRQMVEIQKKTSQLAPDVVVAIVAPSPLAYGMSRVWQSFAYDLGWTSNVFHSRPDAVAWLIKKLGKDVPAQEILDAVSYTHLLGRAPSWRRSASGVSARPASR